MSQNNDDLGFDQSNINPSINNLINCWRNEIHCPEILPYQNELINEVQQLLIDQQEVVNEAIANDDKKDGEYFTANLYQMDLDRIRYSLGRYLRTRLLKLDNMIEFINNNQLFDNLSFYERLYITRLKQLNDNYYNDVILTRVTDNVKSVFEDSDALFIHSQPQLQEFVFCLPLVDINGLELTSGQTINLETKKVTLLQYSSIQEYVLNNQIILL